ncbi:alpha/beta hydrolase [Labedaea rhizosphaerae]|uniref:TAP-like protein n=1 Tax=Labedaea rhizosphaerae TaxID=598644 RepID=A0A4R6SJD1_LABRH|nr:alpha/beta hydrolase [Labedaea rhizosphaerae]TDQ01108.1 TAP-like protein [Labedaea rhizosphaerae]
MPRRMGKAALACVSVVLFGAACTAGPSQSPPILVNDGNGGSPPSASTPPTAATPLPPLERERDSVYPWRDCNETVLKTMPDKRPKALQCTRIAVPLKSPAQPERLQELVTMDKVGTGPAPVLVLNDVSGVPGTVYAVQLADELPADVLTKISLIGVDRRGTGQSDPVRCVPPHARSGYLGSDPAVLDVSGLLDYTSTAGQTCTIDLEEQLLALDTKRTAGDLEVIRAGLGIEKLSAIGHGEGSRVLEQYADLYPDKVGRLVLDGAPEPSLDAQQALADVAAGAEATFDAFARDCLSRSCSLGPDVRKTLTTVLDQVRHDPLDDGDLTGAGIGPGEVMEGVLAGLADPSSWPKLADAIASLRDGDAKGIIAFLTPIMADDRDDPPRFDVTTVTSCNDTKSRLSPDMITKAGADWQHRFPLFGTVIAKRLVLCSSWAAASDPPGPMPARGAPPILVLGTANDPVTPLPGTEHAATALTSGVMVTWQGSGHGALTGSQCAASAARGYLIDGTVPRDGLVCPP